MFRKTWLIFRGPQDFFLKLENLCSRKCLCLTYNWMQNMILIFNVIMSRKNNNVTLNLETYCYSIELKKFVKRLSAQIFCYHIWLPIDYINQWQSNLISPNDCSFLRLKYIIMIRRSYEMIFVQYKRNVIIKFFNWC